MIIGEEEMESLPGDDGFSRKMVCPVCLHGTFYPLNMDAKPCKSGEPRARALKIGRPRIVPRPSTIERLDQLKERSEKWIVRYLCKEPRGFFAPIRIGGNKTRFEAEMIANDHLSQNEERLRKVVSIRAAE